VLADRGEQALVDQRPHPVEALLPPPLVEEPALLEGAAVLEDELPDGIEAETGEAAREH
jgi:hypothetical protein